MPPPRFKSRMTRDISPSTSSPVPTKRKKRSAVRGPHGGHARLHQGIFASFAIIRKSSIKADTVIVGVSPDKAAAQTKFKDKFDLPFTLLADVEHKVAENYGTWVEKSMYGRKYMGIERSTFLIGKDGKIKKIFRKVKPEGHAEEVYEALSA